MTERRRTRQIVLSFIVSEVEEVRWQLTRTRIAQPTK